MRMSTWTYLTLNALTEGTLAENYIFSVNRRHIVH